MKSYASPDWREALGDAVEELWQKKSVIENNEIDQGG